MKASLTTIFSWVAFLFVLSAVLFIELNSNATNQDHIPVLLFLFVGNSIAAVGLYRAHKKNIYTNLRKILLGFWYGVLGQVYSFLLFLIPFAIMVTITGFGG